MADFHQFHTECLERLCRICGNKLKKSKDQWKSSYKCEEYREMLREKFDLETEKDDPLVHPLRFCNACYLSNAKTRSSIVWETHYEGDCKTCSLGLKIKKGGRPPKKGGRKKTTAGVSSTTDQGLESQALLERIQELSTRQSVNRTENFSDKFEFVGEVKEDFNCAVCREILGSPIETKCEHYFCAGCLRQAVGLASTSLLCPVCKDEILPCDLKQPTRMILRLLGELEVKCKRCKNKCHYEDSGKHICPDPITENVAQRVQPIPLAPQPAPAPPLNPPRGSLEQAMVELREGTISPEVEKLGTLFVKSKLKESNDGSAVLKTGGKVSQHKLTNNFGNKFHLLYFGIVHSVPFKILFPHQPLKLVAVRQAQKPSDQVSDRHVRTRTRDLQRFGASVSGDQMNIPVVKHLTSISKAERETMLRDALGKDLVLELPEGEALAMKADLGLSWFRLNKLRRLVINYCN